MGNKKRYLALGGAAILVLAGASIGASYGARVEDIITQLSGVGRTLVLGAAGSISRGGGVQ